MNWILTELGDISESINTGFPSGKHNQNSIGVPHLRPMNISDKGEITLDDLKFVENDDHPTLTKGDILFNNTNSPKLLGKTGYIKENNDWFFSNHMTRIRLFKNLTNSKFYANYLHYLFYKGYYQSHCQNHVNQASVNKTVLSNIQIPLPPLAEQHRIVEKLEEEFTKLDAGVSALKSAKTLIPRYRRSVLKSAMCGDLTKEWRALHPDVESASNLTFNEKDNKIKFDSSCPSSWFFKKLSEIGNLSRGKSKHRPRNDKCLFDGDYPFIQTGDIRKADIFINEYSQTYNENGLKQSKLWQPNTLCITIAANIAETAILVIPACFPDSIVGFTVNNKISDVKFIHYFFELVKEKIEKYAPATAQKNINVKILNEILLPLPPLEEQHEIVCEIERRFSIIDEMEKTIDDSLLTAERLRLSILKKAFEGRLVPQNPDDEPASVLLERIKKEKEEREKATKSKKKSDQKSNESYKKSKDSLK